MNKACKKYISNVKAAFPVIGKAEKQFLKLFQTSVEDFCTNTNCVSIDTLYHEFGMPNEVFITFIQTADTAYVIKKMRQAHFFKFCALVTFSITIITFILRQSLKLLES